METAVQTIDIAAIQSAIARMVADVAGVDPAVLSSMLSRLGGAAWLTVALTVATIAVALQR